MKTRIILLLSVIFVLCSCSSSKSVSKDRITVNSYDKIVSSAGINVHFSKSGSNYVEIEKGSGIAVEVKNNTLIFGRKGGSGRGKSDVYVYGNNIESVVLSGGSSFNTKELKSNNPLTIAASGGSSIRIDKLNANNLNLALSGNSGCSIKQLKGKNLNIATSGNSNASIMIEKADNTNITSSGSSRVTSSGKTQNVTITSSGGADVNITGLKYDNIHQTGKGKVRR